MATTTSITTSNMGSWLLITLVLTWFFTTDPLDLSTLAGTADFHPHYVAPPSHNVLATLPRDTESKLQGAQVVGEGGRFFGPESPAFDSEGSGPYADGRIVRYEGRRDGGPPSPLQPKRGHPFVSMSRPLFG